LAGRISTVDTRAMRVVYKVVQTIGEVTDLTGFITQVTDLIHRELGTGQVNIYLKDALSDGFICQTSGNAEPSVAETRIEAGKGLVGWVAEHCVPARVDDVNHDARGSEGRHPSTRSHL